MKNCFTKAVLVAVVLALLALGRAEGACDNVSIPCFDRCWYDVNGYRGNLIYYCGELSAYALRRNWAVFSIPVFTQQVVSASLRVHLAGMSSPTGSETFQLRHVTTPISN